jgi:hypothetical protein
MIHSGPTGQEEAFSLLSPSLFIILSFFIVYSSVTFFSSSSISSCTFFFCSSSSLAIPLSPLPPSRLASTPLSCPSLQPSSVPSPYLPTPSSHLSSHVLLLFFFCFSILIRRVTRSGFQTNKVC